MATQNYAIKLNGTSQYYTIPDHAGLDFATANYFSIGMWFRPDWDALQLDTLGLSPRLWSRENQLELYLTKKIQDNIKGGSAELTFYLESALVPFTWHTGVRIHTDRSYFIVITGTETTSVTTLKLYLNGDLVATKTDGSDMPADAATAFYVGVDYGTTTGQYFKGNLSSFILDNSAGAVLTAAQISTLWNDGVQDMDIMVALTLDVEIPFNTFTAVTYDNDGSAGAAADGTGVGTPEWMMKLDPMNAKCEMGTGKPQSGKTYEFTGVGQNTGKTLFLDRIVFVESGAGTVSDEIKIEDRNGALIMHHYTEAADYGYDRDFYGREVKGLTVVVQPNTTQTPDGQVYITVR